MKPKSLLLIIPIMLLLMIGCQKDEFVSYKPAMAFLAIRNSSGVDLLDPNLAGGIKAADIDIFVLENGVKKRILNGMLDDPERFKIYKSDNAGYILQLYFDVRKETLQGIR